MSDVLDKIKRIANEEREKANKLKADILLLAEDIKRNRIDIEFKQVEQGVNNHVACAIDGGKYKVDLGDSYLIFAKAVNVTGIYGDVKKIPPRIIRDFKVISDYYGEDEVDKHSIYLMLSLETNLLSEANCDVIFIDGPLIDPPVYDETLSVYFERRSKIIKEKRPIGIVKRFSHRLLIKYLINHGYDLRTFRESYLVTMLMMELRKNMKNKDSVMLGWIKWDDTLKEGNSLPDLVGLTRAYEKFGVSIYSAYFQLSAISPVVRIDAITTNGIEYVKAWGIEGEKEATILNKIADSLAKIGSEEVSNYVSLFQMIRGSDIYQYFSKH